MKNGQILFDFGWDLAFPEVDNGSGMRHRLLTFWFNVGVSRESEDRLNSVRVSSSCQATLVGHILTQQASYRGILTTSRQ